MAIQQSLQGLILDVDGTLLDSRTAQYEWLKYAAQRFGGIKDFLPNDSNFWKAYNTAYETKSMPGLYELVGVDFHAHREQIWKEYTEYNQQHPTALVPGVGEALKTIFELSRVTRARPTALRIGTNSTKTWKDIEPALRKAGILQYFDTIVTKDDVYNCVADGVAKRNKIAFDDFEALRTVLPEKLVKELEKPGTLCSMLALHRLGIDDPQEVIAVEDTAVGVQSYKSIILPRRRVDLHVVGVTWGYEGRDELLAAGADEIIERPAQLVDIVERWSGFL